MESKEQKIKRLEILAQKYYRLWIRTNKQIGKLRELGTYCKIEQRIKDHY